MKTTKLLAGVCAAVLSLSMVSCSDSENKNNSDDISKVTTTTAKADSDSGKQTDSSSSKKDEKKDTNSSGADSTADSSSVSDNKKTNSQGEHIKKAAEFFKQENYTFEIKITDNNNKKSTLKRIVKGKDFYQETTDELGKFGSVSLNGKTYDFDMSAGIYQQNTDSSLDNIILSVVEQNLPRTQTHITSDDMKKFDVEEYTYMGDTYITVLDFYFDKKSGDLKKYVSTYSIEGSDDITVTKEVTSMSDKIDEKALNTDFLKKLKDFNSLSEDERLKLCQDLCSKYKITTDDLSDFGIDTDKLKTISFNDFISLYHNYGKTGN